MAISQEQTGRTNQKARTRQALVEATRRLLAKGMDPSVEDVAAEARVSRTTAYRYFSTKQSLVSAAHPEIQATTLLPEDAPTDPYERLTLMMGAFTALTLEWEPQLRAALRVSLNPGAERPTLRGGRAIGWITEALEPLAETDPSLDLHRLALAIRSATGVEALVWLTDVADCTRQEATAVMTWSAQAMLRAALSGDHPLAPGSATSAR
jgi:AcrR family transcriptional regulator